MYRVLKINFQWSSLDTTSGTSIYTLSFPISFISAYIWILGNYYGFITSTPIPMFGIYSNGIDKSSIQFRYSGYSVVGYTHTYHIMIGH